MDIFIGNEYRVKTIGQNQVLLKKYDRRNIDGKKTGEIGWKKLGYHRDLKQIYVACIQNRLTQSDIKSLEDAVFEIQYLQTEFFKALDRMNAESNQEEGEG